MEDITLTSPAFAPGNPIPERHTADGDDVSPSIWWTGVPDGSEQLAMIVDDPDAPRAEPWVHWVLYGIPGSLDGLPEGLPAGELHAGPLDLKQGKNDFGKIGYGGPAPPKGHGTHHYHFKLYALDTSIDLGPGASKSDLLAAMEGHITGHGELVGTYER